MAHEFNLVNVIISNNQLNNNGTNEGGGIYYRYADVDMINVVVYGNIANQGSGIYLEDNANINLVNSIIWSNSTDQIYVNHADSIIISYSDIEGGQNSINTNVSGSIYWLDGNFDLDPLFTDPDSGDYSLQWGSPCIDVGNPDLDGDGIYWQYDEDDQDLDGTRMDIGATPYFQENVVYLSIDSVQGFREDTILVSVNVTIPDSITFSSYELSFDGFYDHLEFLDVKTEGGLIDNAGWSLYLNETDSVLISASGGTNTISGEGTLFWLKFAVPDTAVYGFVPVNVTSAIFDESDLTIIYTNGGIQVRVIDYGDVSLDGEIHAYDASLILKHLVNLVNLDFQQIENANVSLDATISALDASLIFQYVVELLDSLPYDTIAGSSITANGILSMNDGEFDPNQLVEVPMHLTGGDNIYSFEMEIDYDSTAITYSDINWSSELDHFTIESNLINGRLILAGAGSTPDGQETIFGTINFTINDNFDGDETTVLINKLRWNEEEIIENVATATLSRVLNVDNNYLPIVFSLHQNYPNPFNPTTSLRYDLPENNLVNITIYDMMGREVKTLVNQIQDAGYKSVIWNATNDYGKPVSAGIYLYQIQAGEYISTKKMVLLK